MATRLEKSLASTLAMRAACAPIFLPLFEHCIALAKSSASHGDPQRAGQELAHARKVAAYTVCACGRPAIQQTELCSAHTPDMWRIYDNGGASIDRFSVLVEDGNERWDGDARYVTCLAMSEGGRAFSQFTEALPGKHLGKRIKLDSLDPETRAHIMSRLSLEAEFALR